MSTTRHNRLTDQLCNADLTRVSTATFSIVNTLQNQEGISAGEQLGAMAAAFIITLEASRMSLSDVIAATRNLMADAEGRRPEFKAVTDYVLQEVLSP